MIPKDVEMNYSCLESDVKGFFVEILNPVVYGLQFLFGTFGSGWREWSIELGKFVWYFVKGCFGAAEEFVFVGHEAKGLWKLGFVHLIPFGHFHFQFILFLLMNKTINIV